MFFEKEKQKSGGKYTRSIVLCVLAAAFVFVYVLRLGGLQIIDYSYYHGQANLQSAQKVAIKAARGEILDRYGRPIAINRNGYNIVFEAAYLPSEKLNDTILMLAELLQNNGDEWRDLLPMTQTAPYVFHDEDTADEDDVSRLKSELGLNHYATEQNCYDAMVERYDLQDYGETDRRLLMGVRYTMDLEDYSVSYPFTFAEDISEKARSVIKESSASLPGITVENVPVREYAVEDIAPHLIGTVGPIYAEDWEELKEKGYSYNDRVGKSGVELAFEDYLRGTDGVKRVIQDADGNTVETVVEQEAIPGNTVMLSIDLNLQRVAQEALENVILDMRSKGTGATAGAVVAVNVRTGELLASATYPTYTIQQYNENYETLVQDSSLPLFNRAFNGTYQPGSTFKPGVAAIGLTTGKITPTESIYCSGIYQFSNIPFRCMGYHGSETVVDALMHSCNTFFYETGNRLGINTLNSYCRLLGFGVKTGVELPESEGILAGPDYAKSINATWYPGDTVQAAIGQSYNLFTPLQLATYTATIANGGTRYQTHLLHQVKSYDLTKTVQDQTATVAAETGLSTSALDIVKDGMLAAALDGTASSVFGNYRIDVGGKTGTAQNPGDDHGVFISFAPYENPEIAVAIVVEHGLHGYTTAPAVKALYDAYFFYENEAEPVESVGTLKS